MPARSPLVRSGNKVHPSITLVAAGAFGFLTLIQSVDRPDRSDLAAIK
jgi:hypothetical protein